MDNLFMTGPSLPNQQISCNRQRKTRQPRILPRAALAHPTTSLGSATRCKNDTYLYRSPPLELQAYGSPPLELQAYGSPPPELKAYDSPPSELNLPITDTSPRILPS
eukprot:759615-Hanusia_phi.AAC.1